MPVELARDDVIETDIIQRHVAAIAFFAGRILVAVSQTIRDEGRPTIR